MITNLQGVIEEVSDNGAVVNANGIGFYLNMPASSLKHLGEPGSEVKLYTQLYMKDDGPVLYGFNSKEELKLFCLLQSVSGIGPRAALAVLSAAEVDQIIRAIEGGDVEWLSLIRGIGRKRAERMVLELRDRLKGLSISEGASSTGADSEVIDALTSLGYSLAEARRAVAALPHESAMAIEERLKLSLNYLANIT